MTVNPPRPHAGNGATTGRPAAQADGYRHGSAGRVDEEIRAIIDAEVDDNWIRGAISYHFGWSDEAFTPLPADMRASGGKGLRPALALLCYQAALAGTRPVGDGGDTDAVDAHKAVPFAAAIELVHNFSLIHDDIEDGDRTRRGRPTLWSLVGRAQATNVGDTVHALAFACLGRLEQPRVADRRVPVLVAALSRAVLDLTIGQRRDISFESDPAVDMSMYLQMIAGKTAALSGCATFGGAFLASGREAGAAIAGFREFGRQLGLGFQVRDDILGIWGEQSATGKPTGSDIRRRKKSFPVVFAFETATGGARDRLRRLYDATSDVTEDDEGDIRQILDRCNARGAARSRVEHHAQAARDALAEAAGGIGAVRGNRYFAALEDLADLLSGRNQ